ncbi:MAG: metalloprotease PmbA [Gammaproteobacteria bacterium]|nr:metalloprotease PmbA [Gammaproteobacteria bacterium]
MKMNLQNTSVSGLKSIDACQKILQQTIVLCQRFGATDASVDFQQDIGFSVDVRMQAVDAIRFHQSQGLGIEVYVGKRKGLAQTTDLREVSIEQAVETACAMAKYSAEDDCYGLYESAEIITRELDLYHPWEINPEQAILEAMDLEKRALAQDQRITNSEGASVSSYRFVSAGMNTKGFDEVVYSTRHMRSCSLLAGVGSDMQTDYAWSVARSAVDLDALSDLATLAATRVCARLHPKPIQTQATSLVLSNRVSSDFISHLMGAISGAQLYRKNSFLCNSIGRQVLPKFVHIQEKPYTSGALGSANYDSDGVPTRENVFVEHGQIKQYALGVYSARRLGLETTANADGVHNLHVSHNEENLTSLLQRMGTGFYVTELMGQGVNPLTGDYSRGASGFWVEHGEIQFPVSGVTIAGNLLDMYAKIEAIAADFDKNRATKCGSILLRQVMVAGA